MEFKATIRDAAGTSASKQLRREGLVPGIVYASDLEPINIAMKKSDIELIERELGANSVFDLNIEGDKAHTVFLREISRSSLKPIIYNVNLQAIKKGEKLEVNIPVSIINEDKIADGAGIPSTNLFEVAVRIDPAKAPETLEIDVTGLSIGDSVTVADIADSLSDGEILTDPEEVLVSISAPDTNVEDSNVDGEEVEPELVDEAKTEDGE